MSEVNARGMALTLSVKTWSDHQRDQELDGEHGQNHRDTNVLIYTDRRM